MLSEYSISIPPFSRGIEMELWLKIGRYCEWQLKTLFYHFCIYVMCSFTFTTHGLPSFIFEIHVPESLKVSQGDRLLFYYDKKRILVGILNLRFLQCVWIFWTKYQRYKKLFFWILGDTKVLSWQFNMQLIQLFYRNTQIQVLRQLLKPGYICFVCFSAYR